MISSMTGYGRAESTDNTRKIVVEMRSLNHRYLEVSLRLPNLFLPMEMEIKRKVGEHFSRGRIDVSIKMDADNGGEGENRYSLNLPLLDAYTAFANGLFHGDATCVCHSVRERLATRANEIVRQ